MNDFNYDNEIIELESETEEEKSEELLEEVPKEKPHKKKKKSLKDFWNNLNKWQRLGLVVGIGLILLAIAGVIIYFVVFKGSKPEEEEKNPVIVEKDNYRYEDGNLIFLDRNEVELGRYECNVKDSEQCLVAKSDYTGDEIERIMNVNELGEEIIKPSKIYLDNYVFVKDGEEVFLYDIKENDKALMVHNFKEYLTSRDVIVISDESDRYGLIEITDAGVNYLIRPSYDNLAIVNGNSLYLVAKDKDTSYIIDSASKKLSGNIKGVIASASDSYVVSKENSKYILYALDGTKLLEDYDYIGLHDGLISLVSKGHLYLVNNDLQKLYEEGIRLTSSDYVKKYVYDKDNNLKETKAAYEITVNGNDVVVNLGSSSETINLNEGKVSGTTSYMSYFDGTLYFYKDDEKQDLLSTYKCVNKNELKDNAILDRCTIYTKDNKYSGIYNNNYVFIYDNLSNTDAKIYLYDLKAKKNKGTYSDISFVNDTDMDLDIKQIDTTSTFVIAKSATGENTGNYGVIEITDNNVKGKVEFKYKEIKNNNKHYLMVNKEDSYSVYDSNFKKISNEFDYIDLYDKYYVGINNNSLNVYKYSSALGILNSDLDVKDNKYEIKFDEKGFVITLDDEEYKYDLEGYSRYD